MQWAIMTAHCACSASGCVLNRAGLGKELQFLSGQTGKCLVSMEIPSKVPENGVYYMLICWRVVDLSDD